MRAGSGDGNLGIGCLVITSWMSSAPTGLPSRSVTCAIETLVSVIFLAATSSTVPCLIGMPWGSPDKGVITMSTEITRPRLTSRTKLEMYSSAGLSTISCLVPC